MGKGNKNRNNKKQNGRQNVIGKIFRGTVKWFDIRRGYGFITDEDGNDHFVHHKGIESGRRYIGFEANDPVEFRLVEGMKGPQADSVVLVRNQEDAEYVEDDQDEEYEEEDAPNQEY